MAKDLMKTKVFNRRMLVLGGVQTVGVAALMGRMIQLQAIESDNFSTKAQRNRISVLPLLPERGNILDRSGAEVAINLQNFSAVITPEQASNPSVKSQLNQNASNVMQDDLERVLHLYGEIVGLSPPELQKMISDVKAASPLRPFLLSERLDWQTVAALELSNLSLPGVEIVEGLSRLYPNNATYAHIVGYVGHPTANETKDVSLLKYPGMRVGRTGIEAQLETELRGVPGTREVEVDALGRQIRDLRISSAVRGSSYNLTIETGLQEYALNRLASQRSAAAVVMDVVTGDVYACASVPGFNPNLFVQGLSSDEWNELNTNPYTPLVNKAISGRYAPGSTFKLVTLLAGFEHGLISPQTRIFCNGKYELADQYYHCWARNGHGDVGPRRAIAESCDIFFYQLAELLGIDRIAAAAHQFGLGSVTGVGLKGESRGFVPDRKWKSRIYDTPWLTGDTLITSIGQGYMLATPIQLAQMVSRIATGKAVQPRLIKARNGVDLAPEEFPNLEINPRNLQRLHDYMIDTVEEKYGTAYNVRIKEADKKMAAKTGTSQVMRISLKERQTGILKNEERDWAMRDHALFVAFAPTDAPRYACAVVIEHGGSGGIVAGPIARDLLLDCQYRNPAGI